MTLNGVVALILRYFTEFDSYRGALRKVVEGVVVKQFTFAISSPGEFLVLVCIQSGFHTISRVLPRFGRQASRTVIAIKSDSLSLQN